MAAQAPQKTTSWGQSLQHHGLALCISVIAPLLMTWPLVTNASHRVLRAEYFWDAYANTMIMGSRVDAVTGQGPLSLYDNYFFAPLGDSIVFNENHFGLSWIFAPFYLLSGHPLWAYNVTLLISMGLSVFFTYLLLRHLTKSALTGILMGVSFAFCPYVMFELGRIQLVATQWIPACFPFLHRALERNRRGDAACFWLFYLLQIGTCLYYAMFLVPLLSLLGVVLLVRKRPALPYVLWFLGCGAAAGAVALLMVQPYFSTRDSFELERTLDFASGYDGKFAFFTHVPPTNLTLSDMRHQGQFQGAYEEIAFPGFTPLCLVLLGLATGMGRFFRSVASRRALLIAVRWLAIVPVALLVTAISHSMLVGAVVTWGMCWVLLRDGDPHPFMGRRGVYLAVLILAVVLFLGLFPFEYGGKPVHGLYYYFHTYFPGFNGIRKVSRQAVMTTFAFCILAGFGGAWLFQRLKYRALRASAFFFLLGLVVLELRSFPHPVEPVWAGDSVPKMLRFAASLPSQATLASVPQNEGQRRFFGDAGLAFHNYLALFHKHRFVNGQSSWQPPITELVRHASRQLPEEGARRALLSSGADYLLIYGAELPSQRDLFSDLVQRKNEYQLVFQDGKDSVFRLLGGDDPSLRLLATPPLPPAARAVPPGRLHASSNFSERFTQYAVDGHPESYWSTGRPQARGQYFQVKLAEARPLLALEIRNGARIMDVPASFMLSASNGDDPVKIVMHRPQMQLFHDQVHSPKTFVYRLVFPQPTHADTLRLTVEQALPGHYFSIHELVVYTH